MDIFAVFWLVFQHNPHAVGSKALLTRVAQAKRASREIKERKASIDALNTCSLEILATLISKHAKG